MFKHSLLKLLKEAAAIMKARWHFLFEFIQI
uniref:Uncharacterized protein n=1 Tax=Tetranychus urticae TaxID=32264 RepID=T1JQW1_TETUR